ncbi:hypothetical protein Vretimale_15596 [Volvox reticuliferus]|uniref:peptide-methionine (R)-S-oxide reductase n=1 Tax=Volvox reticuliferus TaxID=1737510 RepID=A0A8J4GR40_9CHLO|nr:hypothetical protein Vretifemale_15039 [Volvox reticuliferus]GIM12188.1 hypothetical protein Vretimale_15596 [Volvox reticuliferus]
MPVMFNTTNRPCRTACTFCASAWAPCPVARVRAVPAGHNRHRQLRLNATSLLGFLFGKGGGLMGSQTSRGAKGWAPRSADTPSKVSRSGYDVTPLNEEERRAAAEGLTQFQKYVVLEHGTERAFTGSTINGYSHDNKQQGVYVSALGGLPLFSSDTKFNSGTGWPSFFAPLDPEHIIEVADYSIPYMPRVEVLDARSGAHLGHVFDDGGCQLGIS